MPKIREEITIETHETCVIYYRRRFARAWCEKCNREVGMISPSDAALLSGKDLKTIDRMMASERFHLSRFGENAKFICLNSLCPI